jgi:DNA-binding NarL/FixJ family response regulator
VTQGRPGPLRVVLADDSFLVREGVRRLLDDGDDVSVVGEAADAAELLQLVGTLAPDAVLTDVRMPPGHRMEGIEAAHDVRRHHPGIGVAVLSQHADATYARALFEDGTAGLAYLLKERVGDRDELVRALSWVADGGSFVDPLVVDALMSGQRREATSPLGRLTGRELDVLRAMAQGQTNPAIAKELHVSESAVSKHISSIFTKLDLGNDVDRRVSAVVAYLTQPPSGRPGRGGPPGGR